MTGEGLDALKRRLAEVAFGRLLELGDVEPVVTRARHRLALERALGEVDAFWAAVGDWLAPASFILFGVILITTYVMRKRRHNAAEVWPPRS